MVLGVFPPGCQEGGALPKWSTQTRKKEACTKYPRSSAGRMAGGRVSGRKTVIFHNHKDNQVQFSFPPKETLTILLTSRERSNCFA